MAKTKKKKKSVKQTKRKSLSSKKKKSLLKNNKKSNSNGKNGKNGILTKLENDTKKLNKNTNKMYQNGRLVAGHKGLKGAGRPKGSFSNVKTSELKQSIVKVESAIGFNWLEYQILKSYDDTTLATSLLARLYPALKAVEQTNFEGDAMPEDVQERIRKEIQKRLNLKFVNNNKK